ncbi:MAG: NnrS family protein [Epsilonproteobacteria bacterium]|nr:NnrS family protein [Campylobacterota bacterium]
MKLFYNSYFFSQPHQPFFLLAIINALVMMIIFALGYKGVASYVIDLQLLHTYSLFFLFFTNAFAGFLFTTFPRFCQTQVISKNYYVSLFGLSVLASVLFVAALGSSVTLVFVAMALMFLMHVGMFWKLFAVYQAGMMPDKKDPFWILVGVGFGLVAHLLFLVSLYSVNLGSIAIMLALYMYIVFVTLAVAQRMIPFFSHSFEPKGRYFMQISFVLLIGDMFVGWVGIVLLQSIIELILAIYLLQEFLRWRLPVFQSPAILWVLHLGLFWLPTAFFVFAFEHLLSYFWQIDLYFLSIHLLMLGFVLTIFIGFGTRVILGHSAQVPHADKLSVIIFGLVQLLVVLRALVGLVTYRFMFDIAVTLWIVLFVLWGGRFARTLLFGAQGKR